MTADQRVAHNYAFTFRHRSSGKREDFTITAFGFRRAQSWALAEIAKRTSTRIARWQMVYMKVTP